MEIDNTDKLVIACHLNIISEKEDPDAAAANSVMTGLRLFWNRPGLAATLGWNKKEITQAGKILAQTETGIANVTKTVLSKYEVTDYHDIKALTKLAVNPKIKKNELEFIQKLKRLGYNVVGVTDQDTVHHKIFRKKTKDLGINTLLDGIITIPYLGKPLKLTTNYRKRKNIDNWYIAKPGCHISHCQALRLLVDTTIAKNAPILMIDMKENKPDDDIHTKLNIELIHFTSLEQLTADLKEKKIIS